MYYYLKQVSKSYWTQLPRETKCDTEPSIRKYTKSAITFFYVIILISKVIIDFLQNVIYNSNSCIKVRNKVVIKWLENHVVMDKQRFIAKKIILTPFQKSTTCWHILFQHVHYSTALKNWIFSLRTSPKLLKLAIKNDVK